MNTVWKVRDAVEGGVTHVDGMPRIIAEVLERRGFISEKEQDAFLSPDYKRDLGDPFDMQDMKKAVEVIERHIKKGSRILVHGDYDVDGITASLILVSTLKHLGADASHILPTREQGYGLNADSVAFIEKEKFNLVITVDCGVRDHKAVDTLMAQKIDVVVTDHHQVAKTLPAALAVVNPSRKDETYEFTKFCGAGVAFKLSQALLATFEPNMLFEKQLLDLAALGTMADMMPLTHENRALVRFGLLMIGISRRPGLIALAEISNIELNTIDALTCGFKIIPYLNAAGRIDNPEIAYKLLASETLEEARELTKQLLDLNTKRRELTKEAFETISASVDETHSVIFEASNKWPRGIAGLIANQLAEAYARPSFVIEILEDRAIGSVRAGGGINVTELLTSCEKHLVVYGGHKQAAGFTVKLDSLDSFKADVVKYIEETSQISEYIQEHIADCEVEFSDISYAVLDYLKKLEPFGEGNPEPQFLSKKVKLVDLRMVGAKADHAKVAFQNHEGIRMKGIAFRKPEFSKLKLGGTFDILYTIRENIWNGKRFIDLCITDLKESQ